MPSAAAACPDPTVNPRGYAECRLTEAIQVYPQGVTTSAAVTVTESVADAGYCIVWAEATVHAHGGVMAYSWAAGWTITLPDGTSVPGPGSSSNYDTDAQITYTAPIEQLTLVPGMRISGSAGIRNLDVGFDRAAHEASWLCQNGGELVEDLLGL
jgi:hypothetical protein